jgi:hypothetical protein
MKEIILLAQPKNPYADLSKMITEVIQEMRSDAPYYGDELKDDQKVVYERYNTFMETFQQTAEKFLEQAQMDFQAGHTQSNDIQMLLNDQLERLQDQVSYMIASLEACNKKEHGHID